jgi:hypothetical protein
VDVKTGVVLICPEIFHGTRCIQWESVEGVLCLRDIWFDRVLPNSSVCLRFGGISCRRIIVLYVMC